MRPDVLVLLADLIDLRLEPDAHVRPTLATARTARTALAELAAPITIS